MRSWNLRELDVEPHRPEVLSSEAEGRVILIELPAGESLQEHQSHERALLMVVSGEVSISDSGGDETPGPAGFLADFAPTERREVRAVTDARLLLLLSPWPGEGHPRNRT